MRVLVANIAAARRDTPSGEFLSSVLAESTRRSMLLAVDGPEQIEIVFRFASEGTPDAAWGASEHLGLIGGDQIPTLVQDAEAEGFDGVVIGCFGDPFLASLRATLNIPVVSFGESSLLLARRLGTRIGIVSSSADLIGPITEQVAALGMREAIVGVVGSDETAAEQERGLVDASASIAEFQRRADELIAAGADVIVPACGVMSPPLRLATGCEDRFPSGVREVQGVPVVDIVGASLRHLQELVRNATLHPAAAASARITQPVPTSATPGSFWDC